MGTEMATDANGFPVLEGFDFDYAMNAVCNEEIVLFTLSQVKQELPNMKAEIEAAYNDVKNGGSADLLRIKVHGLKGVAFSVGQVNIGELSKTIEFAIRDGEIDRGLKLIPMLFEKVDRCIQVLKNFHYEDEDEADYDRDTLIYQLNGLIRAMKGDDFDRADRIVSELNLCSYGEFSQNIDKIKRAEIDLETDDTVKYCEELLALL